MVITNHVGDFKKELSEIFHLDDVLEFDSLEFGIEWAWGETHFELYLFNGLQDVFYTAFPYEVPSPFVESLKLPEGCFRFEFFFKPDALVENSFTTANAHYDCFAQDWQLDALLEGFRQLQHAKEQQES